MRFLIALICMLEMLVVGCAEQSSHAQNPGTPRSSNDTANRQRRQQTESSAIWPRFRGSNGSGISQAKDLPTEWSETKNLLWRCKIPGPGSSSPICVGNRVFLTYYTGYGLDPKGGDQKDLRRHVVCVARDTGRIVWDKEFRPELPESRYEVSNGGHHGYASSTPATDGKRLYVYFGKSGMYCLDLDGNEFWHTIVGNDTSGYGSANSPLLYKNLVIINATCECKALVALDKQTGKEVWRVDNIWRAYNSPVLVDAPDGKKEVVFNESSKVVAFDPESGKELWRVGGFQFYVCPSVIAHEGIVYVIRSHVLAIRAGGRGDVTQSHVLWKVPGGSSVPSPVFHQGRLHWVNEGGNALCVDTASGKTLYNERLTPEPDRVYSSLILADGNFYSVARNGDTYVFSTGPKFKQLAHNVIAGDGSRTNASPIAMGEQLLLRTDGYLYCLGLQSGK